MKIRIMSEDLHEDEGYKIIEAIDEEIDKVRTTGWDDDIIEFELEVKNIKVRQRTKKEIEEGFNTTITQTSKSKEDDYDAKAHESKYP